ATTDGFFLVIDASDPQFEEGGIRQLLKSSGAESVEAVYAPNEPVRVPRRLAFGTAIVLLLSAIPPLAIAIDRLTPSSTPRVHPVPDMDDQPKLKTQAATLLFADRRTMRAPVPGTVPQSNLKEDDHFYRGQVEGKFADSFPEELGPITMELMERGRKRFNIYCAPCHGLAGDGDGIVSLRALQREDSAGWVKPLSLHSDVVRDQPVGKLFNTITNGVRTMPSYATQISPRDRWAIVLYVKALQRSRNGTISDLPEEMRSSLQAGEEK
ncbi:MAG: c-type cytochrome, partial [Planctomycetes bacterium]|nr:c-type cytochrome [Planctomycetota bacterium]